MARATVGPVIFRAARAEDALPICRVRRDALASLVPHAYTGPQMAAWIAKLDPAACRATIVQRHQQVHVACFGRHVVGYAALQGRSLWAAYVAPRLARRGIGKGLVACAERAAVESGIDVLWVSASVPAVPFYERLGYEVHAHSEAVLPTACRDAAEGSMVTLPIVGMRKRLR